MKKNHSIEIQNKENSYFKEDSIYSIDREVIENETNGLFHQSARFLLVQKGSGKIRIQNKIYEIKNKTIISILPWQYTEVISVDSSIQYLILKYNFDIVNKIIKSFYNMDTDEPNLISSFYESPLIQCDNETFSYFSNIFSSLLLELGVDSIYKDKKEGYMSTAFVLNKIIDIIISFRRIQDSKQIQSKDVEDKLDRINIFRYIHSHLSEKLTVSLISKLFFLSESTINRYIKETTGLSFNVLVNEMRIGKTMDMLLYTDLSIEEISEIVGFSDGSHLSKVFNARIGKNPNKYRHTFNHISQICNIENTREFYSVLSYIVKNSSEDLDINDISEKFSISVMELNKLFLYYVEKNFKNFLNFVRINKSVKLLIETNMQVTDIAFEVGYNTIKTFNRNFVKFQKILPTEFRKNINLQLKDI